MNETFLWGPPTAGGALQSVPWMRWVARDQGAPFCVSRKRPVALGLLEGRGDHTRCHTLGVCDAQKASSSIKSL